MRLNARDLFVGGLLAASVWLVGIADAAAAGSSDGSPAILEPPQGTAIAQVLDAQGRLALPPGFSGPIDPQGYALVSKPGEAPRFAPKNAIDDAARWDPQFGISGENGPE